MGESWKSYQVPGGDSGHLDTFHRPLWKICQYQFPFTAFLWVYYRSVVHTSHLDSSRRFSPAVVFRDGCLQLRMLENCSNAFAIGKAGHKMPDQMLKVNILLLNVVCIQEYPGVQGTFYIWINGHTSILHISSSLTPTPD